MAGRYIRPVNGRGGVKKTTKKKKAQVRQAWDSSIQDLNVHRATPEELAHRHEIHQSRNQRLAQWELQEKLLQRKYRKQNGGTPDPLEERRVALMMEILSDQYQMKDVLERSDRAMAVVKDLFGDAPRRHTGFPNVTMAPSCDLETSRGPILQKKDPPTRLSVLSESVMDSQALNDVEDSQCEESDGEVDVSISFQPGLNTDRMYRLLNQEKLPLAADAENPFVTPRSTNAPIDGQRALNATTAVKKVKTRLTEEEREEPEDTKCVIGRVLNPNPPNHRLPTKGRKKRSSHTPSSRRTEPSLSAASAGEISACNQSSLEVLNQMIQEVEQELEDYERQTGREVGAAPKAQGLTGFTLSLVSSIRRLVFYLKEGDRQLRQEALERQRLQEELHEQRLLIDALTAEILSMKSCSLSPLSQQSENDQTLSPPVETSESLPASMPEQRNHSTSLLPTQVRSAMAEPGFHKIEEKPVSRAPPCDRSSEHTLNDVHPLLGFHPAVLLSPPRQRSREEFQEEIAVQRMRLGSSCNSSSPCAEDTDTPDRCHSSADTSSTDQRMRIPLDQSDTRYSASVSSHQSYHASPRGSMDSKSSMVRECGTGDSEAIAVAGNDDLTARLAELALQNNALKDQLKQFSCKTMLNPCPARSGDSETTHQPCPEVKTPMSLEQRIAELNRQSAEARDKLLSLIEQQKQSGGVSPAISPITPQSQDSGSRGRIDAVIPMPRLIDSSIEETPSPDSRSSGRRSSASCRSRSSVSSSYKGSRASGDVSWMKVGRQKEEGWFALTTHVS
ncbi:spindle and centriole-associated protein 1 [Hyperolius riggenbachi]|uniref:spindle and centriole-associated protein 1 n=1 Tax=Hyperolius riggenbachi TaxID=752182 RepID=UPI0035A2B087